MFEEFVKKLFVPTDSLFFPIDMHGNVVRNWMKIFNEMGTTLLDAVGDLKTMLTLHFVKKGMCYWHFLFVITNLTCPYLESFVPMMLSISFMEEEKTVTLNTLSSLQTCPSFISKVICSSSVRKLPSKIPMQTLMMWLERRLHEHRYFRSVSVVMDGMIESFFTLV